MFPLEKTRAAEYADLSSLDQPGFGLLAEPVTCFLEQLAAEGDARADQFLQAEQGNAGFGVDQAVG